MKHAGAGLRLLLFVLVVCSAIALSGCDSEFQGRAAINLSNPPPESENENGPPQGGRIGIVLTDAPSDEFSAVEVTLSRIELLGDGESVELFTGYHTFDLLRLRHFSNLFSVSESVPPGTYHKLRLTLDDLVLLREVEEADGGVMLEEIRPALPAAGVLEVDPREHFTVSDGGMLMIEVDIDPPNARPLSCGPGWRDPGASQGRDEPDPTAAAACWATTSISPSHAPRSQRRSVRQRERKPAD